MPAITIISQLQSQLDQAQKAYELATRSYIDSCTEDEPDGCFALMCEWENASEDFGRAQARLEEAGDTIKAALAAL